MANYPMIPNGAKATLSDYSWIEISSEGEGTLRCYDGSCDEALDLTIKDLIHLGIAVEMALNSQGTSFIRTDGRMLSIAPNTDGPSDAIRLKGATNDWCRLNGSSVRLLQEFCLATLRTVGVLPITVASFSSPQINTFINQTNIQINNF
jgi:hypothetical protein